MFNRLLTAGVLVVFSAAVFPSVAAAYSTSQVEQMLRDAGSMNDVANGDANQFISRGDVIKMLVNGGDAGRASVEKYRARLSKLPLYTDVAQTDPMAPYAEAAFALRITSGFSDRTLRPNDTIPVEEAITLLLRANRLQGLPVPGDTAWYAPYVRSAIGKNIVADPRSMGVGQPITRGQFMDMQYRVSVMRRDNLAAFPRDMVADAPPRIVIAPTVTVASTEPSAPVRVNVARASTDQATLDSVRSSQNFAITIPSLGIRDLTISHPEDPQSKEGLLVPLQTGVGHLFSYPGNGGKIMIYGHSSGYSWDVSKFTKIFRQVNKLRAGDRVFVTYDGNVYEYVVTGQETIAPTDNRPFMGAGEELILYTCWPVGSNKSRLIVRAVPVETIALGQ